MEDTKKNMTNSFELNKKQVTEYPKKQLMHANFQKKNYKWNKLNKATYSTWGNSYEGWLLKFKTSVLNSGFISCLKKGPGFWK